MDKIVALRQPKSRPKPILCVHCDRLAVRVMKRWAEDEPLCRIHAAKALTTEQIWSIDTRYRPDLPKDRNP